MVKFEEQIEKLIGTSDFEISGRECFDGNEIIIKWNNQSFTTLFSFDDCTTLGQSFIHDMFVQRLYYHMVPIFDIPLANNRKKHVK